MYLCKSMNMLRWMWGHAQEVTSSLGIKVVPLVALLILGYTEISRSELPSNKECGGVSGDGTINLCFYF